MSSPKQTKLSVHGQTTGRLWNKGFNDIKNTEYYSTFDFRHSNGEEILKYKAEHYTGDNYSGLFRREKPISSSGTGDLYPGEIYDWSDAEAHNDRDYGIQATYEACKINSQFY